MTLILFVCRGNTCRSPLAEALARRMADDAAVRFASAGIAPSPVGGPASSGALEVAARHGLDLSAHASRAADAGVLAEAAHIIALDCSVRDALMISAPAKLYSRISLLMSYAPHFGNDDVADPWGGTGADYARAYAEIEASVTGLLAKLRQIPPTGSA